MVAKLLHKAQIYPVPQPRTTRTTLCTHAQLIVQHRQLHAISKRLLSCGAGHCQSFHASCDLIVGSRGGRPRVPGTMSVGGPREPARVRHPPHMRGRTMGRRSVGRGAVDVHERHAEGSAHAHVAAPVRVVVVVPPMVVVHPLPAKTMSKLRSG